MIAFAIIAVILLLIALMRLGVNVIYSQDGILVKVKAGVFKITVFPMKKKKPTPKNEEKAKKKKEKKEKKKLEAKAKKAAESEAEKKGGSLELVKKFLPPVLDTLGRLKRKLSVDNLTVHFTSGAKDPFDAAMMFGRVSALEGSIMPLLDNTFKIKKRSITSDVSFDGDGNKIYLNAQITLAFWEIIYIVCGLIPLLTSGIKDTKDGKAEKNGQTSDK